MNIIDAIKTRRSVRSFDGRGLAPQEKELLRRAIAESTTPFGGNVSIRLKEFDLAGGYRPATYGVIRGAEDFFLIATGTDEASALSAGFQFEQVVLRACQMGLGTCWIAATFKGSVFEKDERFPDGETLRIVCPVGKAAGKSLLDKLTRMALGSSNRRPFGELFFTDGFTLPLAPESQFGEALAMMRLAPSSRNAQPWRALAEGDTVHFYYLAKSPLSILDTGIGLCHFYLTEQHHGIAGDFLQLPDAPTCPFGWKYLISYSR